jgi:hypothetical protein
VAGRLRDDYLFRSAQPGPAQAQPSPLSELASKLPTAFTATIGDVHLVVVEISTGKLVDPDTLRSPHSALQELGVVVEPVLSRGLGASYERSGPGWSFSAAVGVSLSSYTRYFDNGLQRGAGLGGPLLYGSLTLRF